MNSEMPGQARHLTKSENMNPNCASLALRQAVAFFIAPFV